VKGDGQVVEVRLEMNFAGEPAARAAETCARTTVLSNICTRRAVLLVSARSPKNASNTPDRLSRQNRFHTLF